MKCWCAEKRLASRLGGIPLNEEFNETKDARLGKRMTIGTQMAISIEEIMTAAPVIPVVVVDDSKIAVKLAQALVDGGLPAIEVTLRTPNAINCIRAIADEVPGAIAGAGTVLETADIEAVTKAGARFMVSPGAPEYLLSAAKDQEIPLLPGVATASEMMTALHHGYKHLKFFPAAAAGGSAYLKSVGGPLISLKFCPTGGISPTNAKEYLALGNVLCVGGSWVAPADLMAAGDWAGIAGLARDAATLK